MWSKCPRKDRRGKSPAGYTHVKAAQRSSKGQVMWIHHWPCLVPSWRAASSVKGAEKRDVFRILLGLLPPQPVPEKKRVWKAKRGFAAFFFARHLFVSRLGSHVLIWDSAHIICKGAWALILRTASCRTLRQVQWNLQPRRQRTHGFKLCGHSGQGGGYWVRAEIWLTIVSSSTGKKKQTTHLHKASPEHEPTNVDPKWPPNT